LTSDVVGYLAAFHAAQAFIFERTGKVAKTHQGYARVNLGVRLGNDAGRNANLTSNGGSGSSGEMERPRTSITPRMTMRDFPPIRPGE
jgi:hypothetical protein